MSSRRHDLRKLSADQIRAIRQLKRDGYTRWAIAERFGISTTALHHILAGSSYKDVK